MALCTKEGWGLRERKKQINPESDFCIQNSDSNLQIKKKSEYFSLKIVKLKSEFRGGRKNLILLWGTDPCPYIVVYV